MRNSWLSLAAIAAAIFMVPDVVAQHLEFPRQIYYTCDQSTAESTLTYFDRDYTRPVPAPRPVPISSYAIGDVAEARVQLSGEARTATPSEENQSVSGRIGVTYASTASRSTFITRVGVSASRDPIESGFGTALLSPGQGGALYSGYIQLNRDRASTNGFYLYGGLDSFDWSAASEVTPLVEGGLTEQDALDQLGIRSVTENVNVGSLGGGWYFNIIKSPINSDNDVRVTLNVGPALRFVSGDAASDQSGQFGDLIVGSGGRAFLGAESGLTVTFNSVQASIQPSVFNGPDNLEGVSGVQVSAGIKIIGSLFRVSSGPRYKPATFNSATGRCDRP